MTRSLAAIFFFVLFHFLLQQHSATAEETPPEAQYSLGDVMVVPTRIIFEGRAHTAEVSLINRSDKRLSYAVSFVNNRMSESGQMQEIDAPGPGERFADSFLRFTPRRVILEPRQAQTVRMQLRKPADLVEGEYRSHLLFRVIPDATEALLPDAGVTSKGLNIKLTPIYGLSIPVIVRHGATQASTRLAGLRVRRTAGSAAAELSLSIEREGSRSIYGDIVAFWDAPGKSDAVVGRLRGIAVYTPNARRTLSLPLLHPKGLDLGGGRVRVLYREAEAGTEQVLAEGVLAIP